MSKKEFYRSIWRFIDSLNEKFYVYLDLSDLKKLENLKLGYVSKQNVLQGAIGALENVLVWQKIPGDAM